MLLRDLAAAVADGDQIYAVISGSAINNDGADKVSYTASSVAGQARAMVEAWLVADVSPDDIGFVECHGTGTVVGDPLEIDALTRAFRTGTTRSGFCAIGSVKTNIGHLEQTAGVAALIKTALGAEPPENPAQPQLSTAQPEDRLRRLALLRQYGVPRLAGSAPRLAAVNSLGLGGTNAFVVLEEAPPVAASLTRRYQPGTVHVLTLSARTRDALRASLAAHRAAFDALPELALGDACHTLNVGRTHHAHRFAVAVSSMAELRSRWPGAAGRWRAEAPSPGLSVLGSGFPVRGHGS